MCTAFCVSVILTEWFKKDNPNRWGPGLEGLGGPFLGERRGKDLTRPVRSSHLGFGKHFCTLGRSVLDWSTPDLEGAPGTSLATAGPDLGRRGMDGICGPGVVGGQRGQRWQWVASC